jgi:hypothetical protein
MHLDLTDPEIDLLTKIVDGYHASLREEIYKTETYNVKDELKQEETILKAMLDKIRTRP